MQQTLPIVGGPRDCDTEVDGGQSLGSKYQVMVHDGYLAGMPMVLCHVYRLMDLDGIRSLLYMGPGNRAPYPYQWREEGSLVMREEMF